MAAPGVYTTVPRDAANEVFTSRGYPKVGGLGHEMDTFAHEGGMQCQEEDVAITKTGCRFLSVPQTEAWLIH